MDETTTPATPASEGTPAPAGTPPAAAPADGLGTATPASGSPGSGGGELEVRVRQEQSRADKAEAELARLKAAAAPAAPATPAPQSTPAGSGLTEDAVKGLLVSGMQMTAALPGLREEFKDADKAIFERAFDFDSVEALRAAASASHMAKQTERDSIRTEEEAKVRAQYEERFGPLQTPSTPTEATGELTLDGFLSLPFDKRMEMLEKQPELVEKLGI